MKFTYYTTSNGIHRKKVTDKNGVTHYLSSKSVKELERKYIEFEHLKSNNKLPSYNTITLDEWANYWLNTYKSNVAYSTQLMYKNAFNYVLPEFGFVRLNTIDESKIMKIITSLNKKPRQQQIVLLTLKQCFEKAVDNDYIVKNPCKAIKLPRYKASEKKFFSDELIAEIKDFSRTDKDFEQLYFMIYTGLRCGELVALDSKSIDWKNKVIVINKSMDLKSNTIKTTKNNEIRQIPILDNIVPILKPKMSQNLLWGQKTNPDKYQTSTTLNRSKAHINKILSEPITWHQARHTYASILHKAGIDVKQAQNWTGHKDIKVLLDIYTHLDKQDNKDSADKLNRFINK